METTAEFLKTPENQSVVLTRVVLALRIRGEWGERGLFAKIAAQSGFTPAYVGRVLNGKQSFTTVFVEKLPAILEVPLKWILGETVIGFFGQELGGELSKEDFEDLSSEYWREQSIKNASSPIMVEIGQCLAKVPPEARRGANSMFRNLCRYIESLPKEELIRQGEELIERLNAQCVCKPEEVSKGKP
jgi:transcriptional regulator with XRE-family HTH domain